MLGFVARTPRQPGGPTTAKKINSTGKITVHTRSGPNRRAPILIMSLSKPFINPTNILPLTYADHILIRP